MAENMPIQVAYFTSDLQTQAIKNMMQEKLGEIKGLKRYSM